MGNACGTAAAAAQPSQTTMAVPREAASAAAPSSASGAASGVAAAAVVGPGDATAGGATAVDGSSGDGGAATRGGEPQPQVTTDASAARSTAAVAAAAAAVPVAAGQVGSLPSFGSPAAAAAGPASAAARSGPFAPRTSGGGLRRGAPWRSEVPMTRRELDAKRDEFWHTAPSFEGKRHVWDALQAAVGTSDDSESLALVAAAGVTLPKNSLAEAYDELGCKYVIPLYCLSNPLNLIEQDDNVHGGAAGADGAAAGATDDDSGDERPLKLRLSDGALDLKWTVRTTHTVSTLRRRLDDADDTRGRQPRFFYAGKQLHEACVLSFDTLPANHVLQVSVLPRN